MRKDFLIRMLIALLGGLALDAAMPDIGLWWLGVPALAALIGSIWGASLRASIVYGVVGGGAFWLAHIEWLTFYLGAVPWLALSALMILWHTLFAVSAAFVVRNRQRLQALPVLLQIPFLTLTVSGLWVIRELLAGSIPYGGFAWARTSEILLDSPFAKLVSYLGITGSGWLLAAAAVLPFALFSCSKFGFSFQTRTLRRQISVLTMVFLAATGAVWLLPAVQLQAIGSPVKAGLVQGNAAAGIFDDRENGSVFRAHAKQSELLIDRVSAEDVSRSAANKPLDVIIWPENAAEFELTETPHNLAAVAELARAADAPLLVGTVLAQSAPAAGESGDQPPVVTNSALLIDSRGEVLARYDKKYPVPFGEYVPNRSFFKLLAPELISLISLDYSPGSTSTVMPIGGAVAGLAICYDMIYDNHQNRLLGEGAELIITQTNNADFATADQSAQQLALIRLQALSTGRYVAAVSTRGPSVLVDPARGDFLTAVTWREAGSDAVYIPRVTGRTPASILGAAVAGAAVVSGCCGVLFRPAAYLLGSFRARAKS